MALFSDFKPWVSIQPQSSKNSGYHDNKNILHRIRILIYRIKSTHEKKSRIRINLKPLNFFLAIFIITLFYRYWEKKLKTDFKDFRAGFGYLAPDPIKIYGPAKVVAQLTQHSTISIICTTKVQLSILLIYSKKQLASIKR